MTGGGLRSLIRRFQWAWIDRRYPMWVWRYEAVWQSVDRWLSGVILYGYPFGLERAMRRAGSES